MRVRYRTEHYVSSGRCLQERQRTMNAVQLTSNRTRVHRYRTVHRRFDYIPSPDVLRIIEHHLENGTDGCLAGVIDYLIRSGQQAITGNGGK